MRSNDDLDEPAEAKIDLSVQKTAHTPGVTAEFPLKIVRFKQNGWL
jgi:hypothetical protein